MSAADRGSSRHREEASAGSSHGKTEFVNIPVAWALRQILLLNIPQVSSAHNVEGLVVFVVGALCTRTRGGTPGAPYDR